MEFGRRLKKVMDLAGAISGHREKMIAHAVANLRFTYKDCSREVDSTVERLCLFGDAEPFLAEREPLGGPGSQVSLVLSYNGSAWLNTAIASIYLVGNRVNVRFSSRAPDVMELTEKIYRPIFGDDVRFFREDGKSFMKKSLEDSEVSAIVAFGNDGNILPYQKDFRRKGKKLVFEGPGQDPFIVFPDADLDLAVGDLMDAKFMYSGQTCTAPKRIFIHSSIYDRFMERIASEVAGLVVGDPADQKTDIGPVASDVAVESIRRQIDEAAGGGAAVVVGGKIEGHMIYPTVLKDVSDDMLGMREEVFGPVAFTASFETEEEVIRRAKKNRYGLRAAVFGSAAPRVAGCLVGEDYCHEVEGYTFGKFGSVSINQTRAESWIGAFVVKPVGGYGHSGWIWETVDGRFGIKQGPKLLSLETAVPAFTPALK